MQEKPCQYFLFKSMFKIKLLPIFIFVMPSSCDDIPEDSARRGTGGEGAAVHDTSHKSLISLVVMLIRHATGEESLCDMMGKVALEAGEVQVLWQGIFQYEVENVMF